MTDPDTISADYSLRPSELASTLALLVEARQPVVVWGAPGCAKSQIAQQVAAQAGREYVDVRALLLDPVDLRGIPWRDSADRTRWAPPAFLPPSDADGSWLINLEELPSALPMVQAALYQLVLDRKCGEYELPEGAALIACGNREGDRGVVHRMPTPLASRFVHLEIRVDAADWCAWGSGNYIHNYEGGIAPEVLILFFAPIVEESPDAPRAVARRNHVRRSTPNRCFWRKLSRVRGHWRWCPFQRAGHNAICGRMPGLVRSYVCNSNIVHRRGAASIRFPSGPCSGAPSARPRRSSSRLSCRSGTNCPIPAPSSTIPRAPWSPTTPAR